MSDRRIIVFAPNVGVGGGLTLVRALVRAWPGDLPAIAFLNARGRAVIEPQGSAADIQWFGSNPRERWRAECELRRISRPGDLILCFHSLPPLLPVRGKVLCYVHNPILVDVVQLRRLSGWVRLRGMLERSVFYLFNHRVDRFIVQTPTMARALANVRGFGTQPVDVLPFVDDSPVASFEQRNDATPSIEWNPAANRKFDFIFVSDGASHKNHLTLFRAWELLAAEGVRPSLAITLHPVRDRGLRAEAMRLADAGLSITDLGQLPHEEILHLYGKSGALLFASYAETFGIPLIEAMVARLPILAAELDFVRDVCEPSVTFDPHSAVSIARAVRRFLGEGRQSVPLLRPAEFIARLRAYAEA